MKTQRHVRATTRRRFFVDTFDLYAARVSHAFIRKQPLNWARCRVIHHPDSARADDARNASGKQARRNSNPKINPVELDDAEKPAAMECCKLQLVKESSRLRNVLRVVGETNKLVAISRQPVATGQALAHRYPVSSRRASPSLMDACCRSSHRRASRLLGE